MKFDHLIDSPVEVVACDPGQSGSIVRLGRGQLTVKRGFKTLQDIAEAFAHLTVASRPEYIVIEAVHAMPGQGVCSMFSFGKSTGVFYGAFYHYCAIRSGLQLDEVSPQKWQNWYKKELGLALAAGEFSSENILPMVLSERFVEQCRKKLHKGERRVDHNAADAVLMALWRLATQ